MIRIHAKHAAAAFVQITHHITGIFIRNRLLSEKQIGSRSTGDASMKPFLKAMDCCGLECHLGRIYRMIGSIVENCLHANYRISGQRSSQNGLLDTFFYCREVVLRNSSAYYLLLKYIWCLQIT